MRIAMLPAVGLLVLVLPAVACEVNDPAAMGCRPDQQFSTFSCACEAKAAAAPSRCALAQSALEALLASAPRACVSDHDCSAYHYRVAPCSRAVVLAKRPASARFTADLLQLQASARSACSADWSHRPACAPAPVAAACRAGACVDVRP